MKKIFFSISILFLTSLVSCSDLLTPKPVDLLSDDLVLNEASDVPNVEIGLYSAFRGATSNIVIAGDLTADNLIHNGTFTQYRELGIKQITPANATASELWGSLYNAIYVANFILEKLPSIQGVSITERTKVMSTAYFIRGYSYFVGLYTFGGIPKVTTTNIQTNRNIPRASTQDILDFILADYNQALNTLTQDPTTPAYASDYAVRAALAKYYLYVQDWAKAEQFATDVITSNKYTLEPKFSNVVQKDFTSESIFEMGYTISDDPATLNTLFESRREIIPSNQEVLALASAESGDRFSSIKFDVANLKGSDNGWSVAKYGTAIEDNNNIVVFRLPELYLIRAEARAQQGNVTGSGSAQEDINVLRTRANAPLVSSVSQSQMLLLVEDERRYELAFEGHRWYDLVRTGRAHDVMSLFSSAWKDKYDVWPIPQREIQNNQALAGHQNPGY